MDSLEYLIEKVLVGPMQSGDFDPQTIPALAAQIDGQISKAYGAQHKSRAAALALKRAGMMVTGIDAEKQQTISLMIARSITESWTQRELYNRLKQVVGLSPRQAEAVQRLRASLTAKKMPPSKVERQVSAYARRLIRQRAKIIATHERKMALEQAKVDGWQYQQQSGELSPLMRRKTVAKKGCCPLCKTKNGAVHHLNDVTDIPPFHPQCRCESVLHEDDSSWETVRVEQIVKGIVRTPGGRVGNDSSLGVKPGKRDNWVERTGPGGKGGELPRYVRIVARGLMKKGHPRSQAIGMAIGILKNWASGKGEVTPKVRAAAAKAIAEWEAMKAKTHVKKGNTMDSGLLPTDMLAAAAKTYVSGLKAGDRIDVMETVRDGDGVHERMAYVTFNGMTMRGDRAFVTYTTFRNEKRSVPLRRVVVPEATEEVLVVEKRDLIRNVASPEGARYFGAPIGTPITPALRAKAKAKHGGKSFDQWKAEGAPKPKAGGVYQQRVENWANALDKAKTSADLDAVRNGLRQDRIKNKIKEADYNQLVAAIDQKRGNLKDGGKAQTEKPKAPTPKAKTPAREAAPKLPTTGKHTVRVGARVKFVRNGVEQPGDWVVDAHVRNGGYRLRDRDSDTVVDVIPDEVRLHNDPKVATKHPGGYKGAIQEMLEKFRAANTVEEARAIWQANEKSIAGMFGKDMARIQAAYRAALRRGNANDRDDFAKPKSKQDGVDWDKPEAKPLGAKGIKNADGAKLAARKKFIQDVFGGDGREGGEPRVRELRAIERELKARALAKPNTEQRDSNRAERELARKPETAKPKRARGEDVVSDFKDRAGIGGPKGALRREASKALQDGKISFRQFKEIEAAIDAMKPRSSSLKRNEQKAAQDARRAVWEDFLNGALDEKKNRLVLNDWESQIRADKRLASADKPALIERLRNASSLVNPDDARNYAGRNKQIDNATELQDLEAIALGIIDDRRAGRINPREFRDLRDKINAKYADKKKRVREANQPPAPQNAKNTAEQFNEAVERVRAAKNPKELQDVVDSLQAGAVDRIAGKRNGVPFIRNVNLKRELNNIIRAKNAELLNAPEADGGKGKGGYSARVVQANDVASADAILDDLDADESLSDDEYNRIAGMVMARKMILKNDPAFVAAREEFKTKSDVERALKIAYSEDQADALLATMMSLNGDDADGADTSSKRFAEALKKIREKQAALVQAQKRLGGAAIASEHPEDNSIQALIAQDKHFSAGGDIANAPVRGLWNYIQNSDQFKVEAKAADGITPKFVITDTKTGEKWWAKGNHGRHATPAGDLKEAWGARLLSFMGVPAPGVKVGQHANMDQARKDAGVGEFFLQRDYGDWEGGGGKVEGHFSGGAAFQDMDAGTDPEGYLRLTLLDYVTGNEDRHGGNIMAYTDANGRRSIAYLDFGLGYGYWDIKAKTGVAFDQWRGRNNHGDRVIAEWARQDTNAKTRIEKIQDELKKINVDTLKAEMRDLGQPDDVVDDWGKQTQERIDDLLGRSAEDIYNRIISRR